MLFDVADVPLVEPNAVPDIFCSGLARIEDVGGNLRFTFFAYQRPICCDPHAMERVVVARLVLTSEAVTSAAMSALAATGTTVFDQIAH